MLEFDLFEIYIIKIYEFMCVYVDQAVANSLMVCFVAATATAAVCESLIIKKRILVKTCMCVQAEI